MAPWKSLLCFLALVSAPLATVAQDSNERANTMFKKLDRNNDGAISKSEANKRLAKYWQRIDSDADGQITLQELTKAMNAQQKRRAAKAKDSGLKPSHADLSYSHDYDRAKLDLWLPKSEKPTALIVYFHGGGFRGGNKSQAYFKDEFLALTKKGVAFAAVGYPLLKDLGVADKDRSEKEVLQICKFTTKAIEYLKTNSKKFNLDTTKFVVAGNSAGALISEYLAYVANLDIKGCLAIQQPIGWELMAKHIEKHEATLILYTKSGPQDKTHHPSYAKSMKARCSEVGVACHVYGSSASGLPPLPDNQSYVSRSVEILRPILFATTTKDKNENKSATQARENQPY